MSGNSRSQLFPNTLSSILSLLGFGTLFFIPIPNPYFLGTLFFIPVPNLYYKIIALTILLGNNVVSMHPFSILLVKFTLNKDNLFKLFMKHKLPQLDRLNIVLNMKEVYQNSTLYSQLFWEMRCHFPFPNVGY